MASSSKFVISCGSVLFTLMIGMGLVFFTLPVSGQDDTQDARASEERKAMDNDRLGKLLKQHFPKAPFKQNAPGVWTIQVDEKPEPKADERDRQRAPAEQNGAAEEQGDGPPEDMAGVLLVMTDEKANRMRIMMPIQPFDPSKAEDLKTALIALHANYDRALDARYAVSDGILWSAFIHPLGSLTEADLDSALHQVQTLRKNTGTTFSSGALLFAPQVEGAEEEDDQEPPVDPTV